MDQNGLSEGPFKTIVIDGPDGRRVLPVIPASQEYIVDYHLGVIATLQMQHNFVVKCNQYEQKIKELEDKVKEQVVQIADQDTKIKRSYLAHTATLYSLQETATMAKYPHESNIFIAERTIRKTQREINRMRKKILRQSSADSSTDSDSDDSNRSGDSALDEDSYSDQSMSPPPHDPCTY